MFKTEVHGTMQNWLSPVNEVFAAFEKSGQVLDSTDNYEHRVFIDNGGKVLFVAHLDTVLTPLLRMNTKRRIWARGLDDRLGCKLAYDLGMELGADILLTDHEEIGGTTAYYHKCKKYNWICEFDRTGTDVVTYGIDSKDWLDALGKSWLIGNGSYSDISEMDVECCCMNLGIGYYKAHDKNSYAIKAELKDQITLFTAFYEKHKDTYFDSDYTYVDWDDGRYGGRYEGDGYEQSPMVEYYICEMCKQNEGEECHGYMICSCCFETLVGTYTSPY